MNNKPAWKQKRSDFVTEKQLMKQCTDFLDKSGLVSRGLVWYWHDNDSRMNKGGLPDLPVMIGKKIVSTLWFEFKSPKGTGKFTPGQKKLNTFLDGKYHTVYVINDCDEFIKIITDRLAAEGD